MLTGADSGKITIRHRYEYNAEGHISKEAWHDPITDAEESYRIYFYYPNGNLAHYEYYWTLSPSPEKAWKVHYSPAGTPLPPSLYKHRGYIINFSLYELVAEEIQTSVFDTPYGIEGEFLQRISGRTYNDQGFVTEQVVTDIDIPSGNSKEVLKMTYEYIEI